MGLEEYFDRRARDGTWGSLYEGGPSLRSYNFLARRAAVSALLAAEGTLERVLDVGCGTADYAPLAADHGGRYFGIDFAPGMVTEARRRAAEAGCPVHLAVGRGEQLPFADASFDVVLALGYVAYFEDPRPALREIRRVLRPRGLLVAQSRNPEVVGWLDKHLVEPAVARLRRRSRPPLPPGWVSVGYSGRALDALLGELGFARAERTWSHFNLLPAVLQRRLPRWHVRLSELLQRLRLPGRRILARNYIAKYVAPT